MQDITKLFDEKFNKTAKNKRRTISHIDAFYGDRNRDSSSGLQDGNKESLISNPAGDVTKLNNIQSMLQRLHVEEQNQGEKPRYLTHRKTKVICTLGQHTSNFAAICDLLKNGMNVVRINMADIKNKEHKVLIDMVRNAAEITKTNCGIFIDLQGPQIRLGELDKDRKSINVKGGQEILLYCKRRVVGNDDFIGVDFPDLAKKLKVGDHIVVNSGQCYLKVIDFVDEDEFLAEQASKEESMTTLGGTRIPKIIQQRGSLSLREPKPLGGAKEMKKKISSSLANLIDQSSEFHHDETGIQNYSNLQRARLIQEGGDQISAIVNVMDRDLNMKSDPSMFEDTQIANCVKASTYRKSKEENLVKQIIEKGKFSNRISSAIREHREPKGVFLLPEDSKAPSEGDLFVNLTPIETPVKKPSLTMIQEEGSSVQPDLNNINKVSKSAKELVSQTAKFGGGFGEKVISLSLTNVDENSQEGGKTPQEGGKTAGGQSKQRRAGFARLASQAMPTIEEKIDKTQEKKNRPVTPTKNPTQTLAEVLENDPIMQLQAKKPAKPATSTSTGGRRRRIVKTAPKKKEPKVIKCVVEIDGKISAKSPLFFPAIDYRQVFDMPVVEPQDLIIINSLIKLGVDFVSISGIESAEDLMEVKDLLSVKGRNIKIIPKISSQKSLKNLDEILEIADGLVIGRGTLGMEFQYEDIAPLQQYITNKCNQQNKPCLLQTHLLTSMVTRWVPMRSEVVDISNAVTEGVDALILTEETAVGKNFKEATAIMAKICYEAECNQKYEVKYNLKQSILLENSKPMSVVQSMSNNAVQAAFMLDAKIIILFSNFSEHAICISKYHPPCPILCVISSETTSKDVMLHSGIFCMTVGSQYGKESLIQKVKKQIVEMGLGTKGDFVVFISGQESQGFTHGSNLIQPDVI